MLGTGQLDEAELLLRKALTIVQEKSGEYHWRTLTTEFSLARTLLAKGEMEKAASLLRLNIEKKSRHLPSNENHPDTLDSVQFLAEIEMARGDLNEAERLAKWAIAGREQSLGRDDPRTLRSVATLAAISRTFEDRPAG